MSGAYLTGPAIRAAIEDGYIQVEPYLPENVGPDSLDLRLHPELKVYTDETLDAKKANATRKFIIPEEGLVLEPGELYLGRTVERTATPRHLPRVEGRSSVGRLGVFVHVTAGRGDHGFNGTWTLEILAVKPVRIYPNMRICQISFATLEGPLEPYTGRYQGQVEATESKFHLARPETPELKKPKGPKSNTNELQLELASVQPMDKYDSRSARKGFVLTMHAQAQGTSRILGLRADVPAQDILEFKIGGSPNLIADKEDPRARQFHDTSCVPLLASPILIAPNSATVRIFVKDRNIPVNAAVICSKIR